MKGKSQAGFVVCLALAIACLFGLPARAQLEDVMDLHQEQAKEKIELEKMKDEINDIKSTVTDSMQALGQLGAQLQRQQAVKEFHLFAKRAGWQIVPGTTAEAYTYNGQIPGPSMRVQEGEVVRIVLHNELKVPTSLYLQGLILPHSINGLPRQGQGLVSPGESFAYQFIASQPGTFWYHPQVVHADQQSRGMYGALVVEPRSVPKTYERDFLVILGQHVVAPASSAPASRPATAKGTRAGGKEAAAPPGLEIVSPVAAPPGSPAVTYFTINGRSAPSIPAMEVRRGERIRLRVINAGQQDFPLHLTGHKFEVASTSGSDGLEPHVSRDTVSVAPGDRIDLEFSADNPGVWSFASNLLAQTTNNGKFPGGTACVVRYAESGKEK